MSPEYLRNAPLAAAKLIALAVLCAGTAAQTRIRIPDFREQAQTITLKPGEPCEDCGRIVSIRETALGRTTVPARFDSTSAASGPAERNLVGAVVYLPLGPSSDKPFVGGVGTPEMKERFGASTYMIAVRMDDGALRTVERGDGARYQAGDRVRLPPSGALELIAE